MKNIKKVNIILLVILILLLGLGIGIGAKYNNESGKNEKLQSEIDTNFCDIIGKLVIDRPYGEMTEVEVYSYIAQDATRSEDALSILYDTSYSKYDELKISLKYLNLYLMKIIDDESSINSDVMKKIHLQVAEIERNLREYSNNEVALKKAIETFYNTMEELYLNDKDVQ